VVDERELLVQIAHAELMTACAGMVQNAIRNSANVQLSSADERAVIARGTMLLLDAGAYLHGGILCLPPRTHLVGSV